MKLDFIHFECARFLISALCRVLMELREQGLSSFDKRIGRRRTARIIRENRLFARRCKAFRRCPATCDVARVAENLLGPPIDSWTPLTGGIAPARRSVSHVHDASVHT